MTKKRLLGFAIAIATMLSMGLTAPIATAVSDEAPPANTEDGGDLAPPPAPEGSPSITDDETTLGTLGDTAAPEDGAGEDGAAEPGDEASNVLGDKSNSEPVEAESSSPQPLEGPHALSATEGNWGQAAYTFDATSGVLTVTGNENASNPYVLGGAEQQPWVLNDDVTGEDIKKIVFENPEGIALPPDSSGLFSDTAGYGETFLTNLKSIEGIEKVDTSDVTSMHFMFGRATSLTSLNLSGWDTSNVTDMSAMFSALWGLTGLDLTGWETTSVTDMHSMFASASGLTSLDLSGWNTANVKYMDEMFWGATGLTSLNLSGWDTSNVTDMSAMFRRASGLSSLDLSGWNTTNVTNMSAMFSNASSLASLDLSGWNTANVKYMGLMFSGADNLANLTIGANTRLESADPVGGGLELVNPSGEGLTGKWVRISTNPPTPSQPWWSGTAEELAKRSTDSSVAAGTYIWQTTTPITFDLNGGAWPEPAPDLSAFTNAGYGSLITLPSETPTRKGLEFAGWLPTGNTADQSLSAGDKLVTTGALTLTAQWGPATPEALADTGGTASALGGTIALLLAAGTLTLWANKRRSQQA